MRKPYLTFWLTLFVSKDRLLQCHCIRRGTAAARFVERRCDKEPLVNAISSTVARQSVQCKQFAERHSEKRDQSVVQESLGMAFIERLDLDGWIIGCDGREPFVPHPLQRPVGIS